MMVVEGPEKDKVDGHPTGNSDEGNLVRMRKVGVTNWHFSRSFRLISHNTYDP